MFPKQAATAQEVERPITKRKNAGSSLATALSISRLESDLKSGENEIFLRFRRFYSILPISNLRNLRNISFSPISFRLFKSHQQG